MRYTSYHSLKNISFALKHSCERPLSSAFKLNARASDLVDLVAAIVDHLAPDLWWLVTAVVDDVAATSVDFTASPVNL